MERDQEKYKIIIDTNVIVSGLHSSLGASFKLLSILNDKKIQLTLSNSVIFEYEEVLKRKKDFIHLSIQEIDSIIDDICSLASEQNIYFIWRPLTVDPDDDLFVDLAIAANVDYLIIYNISNFQNVKKLGIKIVTPKEFLKEIGELS